jgi:hypothetical protein
VSALIEFAIVVAFIFGMRACSQIAPRSAPDFCDADDGVAMR